MLQRTVKDPTPKSVQAHIQRPVGKVVCPHCHKETNISASDLFYLIGGPHPYQESLQHSELPVIVRDQTVICTQCSGAIGICKEGQNLAIYPIGVGDSVLKAEAILARKQKEAAQANLRPPEII